MRRRVVTAFEKEILATVSQELTAKVRGTLGYAAVSRAIRSAQIFTNPAIVSTLSAQLRWSDFSERLRARLHQAIEHAREQA